MADKPPADDGANEDKAKANIKAWFGEVLDEREKAKADKDAADAKAKADEDAKRPKPFNLLTSLFGE
jgi:hypothetical protein